MYSIRNQGVKKCFLARKKVFVCMLAQGYTGSFASLFKQLV